MRLLFKMVGKAFITHLTPSVSACVRVFPTHSRVKSRTTVKRDDGVGDRHVSVERTKATLRSSRH